MSKEKEYVDIRCCPCAHDIVCHHQKNIESALSQILDSDTYDPKWANTWPDIWGFVSSRCKYARLESFEEVLKKEGLA